MREDRSTERRRRAAGGDGRRAAAEIDGDVAAEDLQIPLMRKEEEEERGRREGKPESFAF